MESATGTELGLVERFSLKAFVEACSIVDEGIAGSKDTDLGMMMGAGILPGPLARADAEGLDTTLERLEAAQREWGDRFAPPPLLRRLVNQGRLGKDSGQGFFPYPSPDAQQRDTAMLERREHGVGVVWLNSPPMNAISPQVIRDLTSLWEEISSDGEIRAVVFASTTFAVFCAGADIKSFQQMDEAGGRELLELGHGLMRDMERSSVVTIAAVNSLALGGGCELAMACDARIAAEGAAFGQPEVDLGIIPGFGGTQRLPRLVGEAKALEMNLSGDSISAAQAYELGLANEVVPDHELFDTALARARHFAGKAPLAVEQIKSASAKGDIDEGIEAEKEAFATAFASEDAREGISAFLGKRAPNWQGR